MTPMMEIEFEIDGNPARFRRDDWTGRAELSVGTDTFPLQSPWNPKTHFSLGTRRTWRHRLGNHLVEIVKVRPRFNWGGTQPNSFTVLVDNQVVAQQDGWTRPPR